MSAHASRQPILLEMLFRINECSAELKLVNCKMIDKLQDLE